MEKTVRTFYYGDFINMEIGQEVTVARCSSGHTKFGEPALLDRMTKQHLVFKTESGKIVKCDIENMSQTVGKAKKAGYFIIVRKFEEIDNMIHSKVML